MIRFVEKTHTRTKCGHGAEFEAPPCVFYYYMSCLRLPEKKSWKPIPSHVWSSFYHSLSYSRAISVATSVLQFRARPIGNCAGNPMFDGKNVFPVNFPNWKSIGKPKIYPCFMARACWAQSSPPSTCDLKNTKYHKHYYTISIYIYNYISPYI